MLSKPAYSYIMPSEQIIEFVSKNFSKFKTIVLGQTVEQENGDIREVFEERVWMKSPDSFHAEISGEGPSENFAVDKWYWYLLLASSEERLASLLHGLGIRMDAVAFTRIDGLIAYRIGEKDPDRPKLLVGKEWFLPLLLVYRSPEDPEVIISIHFSDYRKMDGGWYPFKMTVSYGEARRWNYTIDTFSPNEPIDESVFQTSKQPPRGDDGTVQGKEATDNERLRRIIKTFEEKYGQQN